ncbi:uncharacterized protein LOC110867116 [Helianthus annuus]|uniref:uncharacterized protein LOC110867116 n=1 Tax=Helianthus annuus TaxID=4232 RepID=UPI000B900609|nr:uncharacterized protein LOC110867116 [Helianthus annuus]
MLEWFDSMEVTFINSECPEELKVRSATGVFQARALDWWTNERNIRSNELAYALSWEELRQLMMEEFCPPHEQQKLEEEFWTLKQVGDENLAYTTRFKQLCFIVPHLVLTTERTIRKYINGLPPTMRDTIEAARLDNIEDVYRLAASLNNNRVRDKQVAAASKPTSSSKPAHQITHNNRGKKRAHQSSVCNAVTPVENPKPNPAIPEKKQYTGTNPKCTTCHFHHPTTSPCRHCTSCNRYGHLAAYCRNNPTAAQNSKPANVVRACFKCGDPNHLRPQCPQLRQDLQQKAPQGRAFVINAQQARNDNEVVNDKCFVSVEFEPLLNCTRSKLPKSFPVEVANGKSIRVDSVLRNCTLTLNDHAFSIDLIPMELGSFDIIVGMDWLRKNHAEIACFEKYVRLPLPSGDTLHMRDYMQQQDRTNDRILREIDNIKKLKRSAEDHSPLMPRSLNFDPPVTTAQHSTASGVQILIDGGSSVNIIQVDVLKKMNISESEIIPRSSVLIAYPVVMLIILGRPWIHDMKAVPSTYHQCVKLPTPWGVVKIESDQQEAKNCYTSSMKPTQDPWSNSN